MRNGNPGKDILAAAAFALVAALCLAGGSLALAEAGVALAGDGQAAGGGAASVAAGGADGVLQAASTLAALDEDADDGGANEEGATITDDQGIVYEVTAAATADEPGEAEVSDGSGLTEADATVGEVTQQVGGVTYAYAVTAVASSAFQGNGTLKSIEFEEDLTGSETASVGTYAFSGCTSLVSVGFPAEVSGIGSYAFSGCTALQSVTFEAGNPNGAYAYWDGAGAGLSVSDCPALTSVVYECAQAFWGDPNGSIRNQSYTDMWGDGDGQLTLYYAVDFYATDDVSEVEDDDCRASGRYARVELANGTGTDAIKAGDAEALEVYLADADLYAEDGYDHDGEVPDPNEAAAQANLDTSVSWAWRLTGSQSQREGLTESCAAYLVQASDLSAGRLHTPVASALQQRCDQNYSR